MTGVATLVLAPFGGYALNLSAITAAICMGEEAHADKAKRYTAAVACGLIYIAIGLVGAAVTGLLLAFPKELVLAIAGLALLGSIGGGLHTALRDDQPPRGRADHLPRHPQRRRSSPASARPSGAWSPARSRCLCNSTGLPAKPLESSMNILFVADPLATFQTYKDSTFAMMRELQKRGHAVAATASRNTWQWQQRPSRQRARCGASPSRAKPTTGLRSAVKPPEPVHGFDAVLMRKDPPFDSEFFYATHLLEQAEREGARVFNSPRALRDHPEKLALMEFAQFAPPTLVTRSADHVRAFHAEHKDIILKPLDGMGGMGIFRVGADGMNLGSIIETLNQGGATSVMVQRYLPEIALGDKRLLLIGGKVAPFVLARIPKAVRCAATWPPGARAWRSRCPIRTAPWPRPLRRCWPRVACCWWGWT